MKNKTLIYSIICCFATLFIGVVIGYALGILTVYTPQSYQINYKAVTP